MTAHFVYIIYSESANRFYVGETINVEERVKQHNSGFYKGVSTKVSADWEIYLKIECPSRKTALKIERFIKKMRNRNFYFKLKENPGMISELISKFNN